jgi:hypothetical protein
MDDVQRTGLPVTVTKRGKPVVRVVPVLRAATENPPLLGAGKSLVLYMGDVISPTGEKWDAERFLDLRGIREVPVNSLIGRVAGELPGDLHGDPADRIIVATASVLGYPLATRDRNILNFAESHGGFSCIVA